MENSCKTFKYEEHSPESVTTKQMKVDAEGFIVNLKFQ